MVKEWRTATIRDVSTIFGRIGFRGYTKKDIVDFYEGAISLSPSNLKDGKIMTDNSTFISWDKYNESPEIKIQIGDVVLVKTGSTYGKSAYVDALTWATTLNPQIVVFKNIKINGKLFAYLIQTPEFKKQIESTIVGGAIPTLSQNQVYKFQIVFPENSGEQQRIAEAFSDVDGMISSLEKLIAKYKSIKTACLQQMFPQNGETVPRMRLPGFTGAWEQRKLGDVVQITMGQSPDGSTYSDEPSDYILVQGNADLQNGWVCPRVWTTQITKKADAGDLIMSVRAPAGAMGKTAYNAVIGRGVAAIKGNEFIYQLLVKMDVDGFWKTLSCGSTFESLNSDNIKNAEVKIPTTAEQIKIGGYFQQLDNLITLHQRKLEKVQKIKQGMMQQLLTGKIRLV